MDPQEDSERRGDDADHGQSKPPAQHQPHEKGDARHVEQRHAGRNKPPRNWFTILSLVFDGTLALTAIVGGYFVHRQLQLTELALVETRKGVDSALEGIKESRRQFEISRDGAKLDAEARASHDRSVLNAMLGANREIAASNSITREAMVASVRPWVFMTRADLEQLDGSFLRIKITYRNSGGSPARNISLNGNALIHQSADGPVLPSHLQGLKRIDGRWGGNAVVGPGQQRVIHLRVPGLLTEELHSAIRDGRSILTVGFNLVYTDSFAPKPRFTNICVEYSAELRVLETCKSSRISRNYSPDEQ